MKLKVTLWNRNEDQMLQRILRREIPFHIMKFILPRLGYLRTTAGGDFKGSKDDHALEKSDT